MKHFLPISVLHVNCDVCGFTFPSKDYVQLHVTKQMNCWNERISNLFIHVDCNICGLTFYSKEYRKHYLTRYMDSKSRKFPKFASHVNFEGRVVIFLVLLFISKEYIRLHLNMGFRE